MKEPQKVKITGGPFGKTIEVYVDGVKAEWLTAARWSVEVDEPSWLQLEYACTEVEIEGMAVVTHHCPMGRDRE